MRSWRPWRSQGRNGEISPVGPRRWETEGRGGRRHQQLWRRSGACSAGRPCYPLGLTRLPPELLSVTTACGDRGSGGGSGREKLCEGMAAGAGTDAEGGSGAHRPLAAGPPSASNHLESDVGFGSNVGGSGGVFDRLSGGDLARCRAVHSSWRDWLDQGEEHEEGAAAEGLKQTVAAAEEEEEAAGTGRRTGGSSKPRHWQASVGGGRRLLWQRAAVADGLYDLALNPAPDPKGQPQPADRSNKASIGCNAPAGRVQLEVGDGDNAGQWQVEGPRELDAGGDGGHTAAQMSSLCHSLSSYREFALRGVGACGLTLREVAHTRGVALCGSAGCEQLAACEAHSKAASARAARRVYTLRMALESLDLKAAAIAVGGNGDGDGGTAAAAHVAGILRRGMESGVRPALHATCEAIIGAATAIKHEMMAMLELSTKL
eukprot:XP_001698659.1 predicted protein [Chlamydomonas reinhardtii]